MRKTKIICTLGPSTDYPEVLEKLMLSGMNVARFNFSHQTHEDHKKRFDQIVAIREKLKLPVATLLDTKGPEIRLHLFDGGKATLADGAEFTLYTKEILGDSTKASITYTGLPNDISAGARILIDDGLIELRVLDFNAQRIRCQVVHGGVVSNRKSCNLPGVKLALPYMSAADEADIRFGVEVGFDFIAASFVRSDEDVLAVRSVLHKANCHHIRIIAKIENAEGVENIDKILHVADGIMVARGDMGVEVPFEQLPALQKILIKKAYRAGKMVITATQMLESMIKSPRPTRAEASDVANAIYDGTSAIMLSGETAAGEHPVEALETMAKIAKTTEQDIDYVKRFKTRDLLDNPNVTTAISEATVTTAHTLSANAIITVTKSGLTARMISKFRPTTPIIGCSTDDRVCRQLSMSWGVVPLHVDEKDSTDDLFDHSVQTAVKAGFVGSGDLVVITAGVPLGISGTTNLLKVHVVGDILLSGTGLTGGTVCANLCVCKSEEQALREFTSGSILVIPETSNALLPLLRDAAGIITEKDGATSHAAIAGMSLEKPVVVGATYATDILKSGVTVTLDATRGIVCRSD